jgi:hypothetical protein
LNIINELLLDFALEDDAKDHVVEDVDIDHLIRNQYDITKQKVDFVLVNAHIFHDIGEILQLDEMKKQVRLAVFLELCE